MGSLRDYVEGRGLQLVGKYETELEKFRTASDNWFDGTPNSVDRRLGKCRTLIASASAKVADGEIGDVSEHIATLQELTADRESLRSLREDLLNGASGREARVDSLLGRRTAITNEADPTPFNGDGAIAGDWAGQDVGSSAEPALGGHLGHRDRRWVELESAKFLRSADKVDQYRTEEMFIRARDYARLANRAEAVVEAFALRVAQRSRLLPQPRTAARQQADTSDLGLYL